MKFKSSISGSLIVMESKIDCFLMREKRLMKGRKRKAGIYIFGNIVSNHFPGVQVDYDTEVEKIRSAFGACNIADPYFVGASARKFRLSLLG